VAWVEEECGEVLEVVVVGIVDAEEVVIHQLPYLPDSLNHLIY
jgi:hypothetical protein